MIVTVLASGSKGNSTLIETSTKNILIDAGLPLSNLEKRLAKPLPTIDILIITHTHSDHTKGLSSILKKHNPIIYSLKDSKLESLITNKKITNDKYYEDKNINIELFELSHDVPCQGVYIKEQEEELVYITDTGYVKEKLLDKYKNKTVYILESNYEEELLNNCNRPFEIKQRIRGDKGHISNEYACRYLKKLIGQNTKYIFLAHISEDNNSQEIIESRINKLLPEIKYTPKKIIIASQIEKKSINL